MTQIGDADRLIGELGSALGFGQVAANADGGYRLTLDGETDVFLFGGEGGESLMAVAPVGALPLRPDYATVLHLFRQNLFDSPNGDFRIAADEGGTLVLWARLITAGLDGEGLAQLLDALSARVAELRAQLAGEDEPAGGDALPSGEDAEPSQMLHFRA